jgi:hypothetical protein
MSEIHQSYQCEFHGANIKANWEVSDTQFLVQLLHGCSKKIAASMIKRGKRERCNNFETQIIHLS